MVDRSITAELLSCVSSHNYVENISCLDTSDFVPIRDFPRTELGKIFVLDRSNCLRNGVINNNQLFTRFGLFSDEEAESVQSDIMDRLQTGAKVYEYVGKEFFECRNTTFREWALSACSQYYYGDELLMFAMCQVFHRHALIICRNRYWCTAETSETMTVDDMLKLCDLHLIYIRPGIFRELVLKRKYG